MPIRLLTTVMLISPLLASADTLILKTGSRLRGNFNTANSTQLSFTEYNGNRQNLNIYDVQELRFGDDASGPNQRNPDNPGFGRNSAAGVGNPQGDLQNRSPSASYSPADDIDRLQSDLQVAMGNSRISDDQRQSLQDSGAVLQSAARQIRSNRAMDQRAVRLALDSVRNAANVFPPRDRDNLLDDIRRISAGVNAMPTSGGRDY